MDLMEALLKLQGIGLMAPESFYNAIKEDLNKLGEEFARLYKVEAELNKLKSTYQSEVLDAFTRGIEQGRNEVAEDDGK